MFGISIPITGLIMSVLMFVPPTAAKIDIWISMVSLVPTLIWMILMSRWLFGMARKMMRNETIDWMLGIWFFACQVEINRILKFAVNVEVSWN